MKGKVYKKYKGKKSLTKKVYSIERKMKEFQPEVKAITTVVSGLTLTSSLQSTNPLVYTMNGLLQGTGDEGRIGDKVRFTYLNAKVRVLATASLTSSALIRILIVKEKTSLGSPLSLQSYFGIANPTVWHVRNVTNRDPKRYKTYFDKIYTLGVNVFTQNGIGTSPVYNQSKPEDFVVSINKRLSFITDYSRGNVGDATDMDSNGLYIIMLTDTGVANAVDCRMHYNLFYVDP